MNSNPSDQSFCRPNSLVIRSHFHNVFFSQFAAILFLNQKISMIVVVIQNIHIFLYFRPGNQHRQSVICYVTANLHNCESPLEHQHGEKRQ